MKWFVALTNVFGNLFSILMHKKNLYVWRLKFKFKRFCVNKAMPALPINVEDAARSDVEIEKALQVHSLVKTSLPISPVIPTYLSVSIRRCYQLAAYLQSAWTLLKILTSFVILKRWPFLRIFIIGSFEGCRMESSLFWLTKILVWTIEFLTCERLLIKEFFAFSVKLWM